MSCSVIIFHVLITCVSFDYVANFKNEWTFIIRDFIVPTNCVLPCLLNNHETPTDFHEFFFLSSYNQSWNHGKPTVKELYAIYTETVNRLGWRKTLGHSIMKSQWGLAIKTLMQKLLTIDKFNKCSFIFQQSRPIECVRHNSFEISMMSSQVVYCSIIL